MATTNTPTIVRAKRERNAPEQLSPPQTPTTTPSSSSSLNLNGTQPPANEGESSIASSSTHLPLVSNEDVIADSKNSATKAVGICVSQAEKATSQIIADLAETFQVLETFAINPDEVLHLCEDWLNNILDEFLSQKEALKLKLHSMWKSHKLQGKQADKGARQQRLLADLLFLEQWKMSGLAEKLADIEKLVIIDNGVLKKVDPGLQAKVNEFLEDLMKVNEALSFVASYEEGRGTLTEHFKNSLEENSRLLNMLRQLNNKGIYTIVIIGLEKAGKSTFINAFLKCNVVPVDENRCTAVATELLPSPDPFLSYSVEFFTAEDIEALLKNRLVPDTMTPEEKERDDFRIRNENHRYIGRPTEEGRATTKAEEDRLIEKLANYLDMSKQNQGDITYGIKKVTIYTNKLPEGVKLRIKDLPGVDSPIKEHRDATLRSVVEADAFMFVTSAARPQFTQPQVELLNEIKRHYLAMDKAFALVTHLDTMHTREKYETSLSKSTAELESLGFHRANIFPICSLTRLYEATKPHSDELRKLKEIVKDFPGLASGFADFEFALTEFITNELPVQYQRSIAQLAQKRLAPQATAAITEGRRILPDYISRADMLDRDIEIKNAEQWGEIYERERFEPTVRNAVDYKNHTIIYERCIRNEELMKYFAEKFNIERQNGNFAVESLEKLMKAYRGAGRIQLNHRIVEDTERDRLSEEFMRCIDTLATSVANMLYKNIVEKFVAELCKICEEQQMIFTTRLQPERCQYEVHALMKRVALPLVQATLRWSHEDVKVRELAVIELTRIVPWVALQVCSSKNNLEVPHLMKFVAHALEFSTGIRGAFQAPSSLHIATLPDPLENLLKVVWKAY